MKKTILSSKGLSAWAIAAAMAVAVVSCDKNDNPVTPTGPTGDLTVSDQTVSQDMITVGKVNMSQEGWVVVHKSNGNGGPIIPDIISVPKQVDAGTSDSVKVQLDSTVSLQDGDTVWVMLHTDNGTEGQYEFDGQNGLDAPLLNSDSSIVMKSIIVSKPSITADDQPVNNHEITIAKVNAGTDGWLVVHNDNGLGGMVLPGDVGKTHVQAGENTNVVVKLDSTVTFNTGQKLFLMLHIDADPVGEYDFPGVDVPEIFGTAQDIVLTSITVQ